MDLENYEAILFHKNISSNQRGFYNKHRSDLENLNGKILIEVDFKQMFVIGLSPRQVSSEYYNQLSRSCLGFGIYYVATNENKIKLINFDIISSDLSSDGNAAVRGFRILRQQQFFKDIDQLNYIVWCDTGKHFRNYEMTGYLFEELKQENIHGKEF